MFKDMRATIEIRLDKPIKELWNNLDKDARWGVNKAKKENLQIKIVEKEGELWEDFYKLYVETIVRGGIVPEKIDELKKETDKLFLCIKDDKIIAGAAIKIINEKTELFLNASDYEFLKFQPNNLLYWSIIEWSKNNNFKIFDLGGYQLNTKKDDKLYHVNRFKERWGGEIITYEIKSKNPVYILGRKVIRNIHWIKILKDKIKLGLYLAKEIISKNNLKVKNLIAKNGFFYFLKIVFKKVLYDRKTFVLFSSDLKDNQKINPRVKVISKKLAPEEFNKLVKPNSISPEEFEKRFDRGDECFVFLKGDKLVHYSWLAYKKMDITELRIKIPLNEKEACIFDCFTSEESRGLNLYPSMLCKIKDYLYKKGFTKCYIYSDIKNESSIKGIERAGFKRLKLLSYLNFLGFKKRKIEEIKILRSNS